MAAFWMCELAPVDTFNRNQLLLREALIHAGGNRIGGVPAGPRVLEVLVVGGEPDAADGLAMLVQRRGHAVRVAYDGLAGLRVAASQHPDVVLLDVALPPVNACHVARQLRLDFPRNECFIISAVAGRPDEKCAEQCSEAGIDLVLVKPVDPSIFETLLMLERERVNRSQVEGAVTLASRGKSQFAPLNLVSLKQQALV